VLEWAGIIVPGDAIGVCTSVQQELEQVCIATFESGLEWGKLGIRPFGNQPLDAFKFALAAGNDHGGTVLGIVTRLIDIGPLVQHLLHKVQVPNTGSHGKCGLVDLRSAINEEVGNVDMTMIHRLT